MTENMQCAICHDTMTEPVTALCGAHNFCKACLTAHIQSCSPSHYGYYAATCPTCRKPIQADTSQLHVNITLRDMIEAASAAPVSAATVTKTAAPPIRISAKRITETNKLLVELSVHEAAEDSTMETDFILTIDNSGSMGNSSMDSTQAGSDAAVFSRSDLVRHAVATQIELLRPEDRMALVLFDNNATIALPMTPMTTAGRSAAKAQLPRIGPNGGTSIWSGLQKALTIAASNTGKNTVIILQTDGESDPSLNPPRGIPATFRAWKDAHPEVKFTLHTIGYGFGSALDMALLRRLAEIGDGTANYVPDGSMVGTVFIHLLANLLTCQYRGVKLHIPGQGICIPVGYLQAGAPRNFVLELPDTATEITATADNTTTVFSTTDIGEITEADAAWPLAHNQLCTSLRTALNMGASYNLAPLVSFLSSLSAEAHVAAVVKDITAPGKYEGQFGKAFASADAWTRWGQHYMSGVVCGLECEWPINFKDATSATFGTPSGMTRRLIDRGDEVFNSLPPPTASCAPRPGLYGGASSYVAPTSMASTNSSSGPCFLGASRMKMADGTEKRCDEIRAGDVDAAGYRIQCVIKTKTTYANIVRLNAPDTEGGFTPWHPVFVDGKWQHPADIGTVECVETDAIYNFVLAPSSTSSKDPLSNIYPGVVSINGIMTCTMGHDMVGPVIGHSYFGPTQQDRDAGRRSILTDLRLCPGWDEGLIIWDTATLRTIYDPDTGVISGFAPPNNNNNNKCDA